MIESVRVKNFKSLRDVNIDFEKLTVFVGKNNSGKSALFESLLYLDQALDSNIKDATEVSSPEVMGTRFSNPEELFYRNRDPPEEEMSIVPRFDVSATIPNEQLDNIAKILGYEDGFPTSSFFIGAKFSVDGWAPIFEVCEDSVGYTTDVILSPGIDEPISIKDLTTIDTDTRNSEKTDSSTTETEELYSIGTDIGIFEFLEKTLQTEFDQLYYILDNRGIVKWGSTPEQLDFVGHSGENTVSMLHGLRDFEEKFEKAVDALAKIADDVEEMRANLYGTNTRTELRDKDTGELINIVSSGAGLRRILPIIVQVAAANPGDTIMIEEPEIGVFPQAQQRLLEFLVENIVEKDIQIILSTHSHDFLWKLDEFMTDRNQPDLFTNEGIKMEDIGKAVRFEKHNGETETTDVGLDEAHSVLQYQAEWWPDQ